LEPTTVGPLRIGRRDGRSFAPTPFMKIKTTPMPAVKEVLRDPSMMETVAEEAARSIKDEQRKTALAKLESKSGDAQSKGAQAWLK
jgi:hypothetical protein